MSRLDELQRVFGGEVRTRDERQWLDTRISGLRAFIIRRGHGGTTTFELAMFTPRARDIDPFLARIDTAEWILDPDQGLPRLPRGFLFTGCRGGVLFATCIGEPSLEDIVSTAWELARWAHLDWRQRTAADIPRRRTLPLPWIVLALVALVIASRACRTRAPAAVDTSAASAPGTSGTSSRARS